MGCLRQLDVLFVCLFCCWCSFKLFSLSGCVQWFLATPACMLYHILFNCCSMKDIWAISSLEVWIKIPTRLEWLDLCKSKFPLVSVKEWSGWVMSYLHVWCFGELPSCFWSGCTTSHSDEQCVNGRVNDPVSRCLPLPHRVGNCRPCAILGPEHWDF